jgi:hypothetical protein
MDYSTSLADLMALKFPVWSITDWSQKRVGRSDNFKPKPYSRMIFDAHCIQCDQIQLFTGSLTNHFWCTVCGTEFACRMCQCSMFLDDWFQKNNRTHYPMRCSGDTRDYLQDPARTFWRCPRLQCKRRDRTYEEMLDFDTKIVAAINTGFKFSPDDRIPVKNTRDLGVNVDKLIEDFF